METVKVIIPIYTTEFVQWEWRSLENTLKTLYRYTCVFVKPATLDVSELIVKFPTAEFVSVNPQWLSARSGIGGYNEMMMSADFYRLFDDCQYLLICQTDAWIFRDDLQIWCEKGYDYVGAPWLRPEKYNHFPLKQILWLRQQLCGEKRILRQHLFERVGNGGLSLRRVEAFRKACVHYRDEIERFCKNSHHFYHEDVFFSLVPTEFRYPSVEEALQFSFDMKPQLCFERNNRQLPFGCHKFNSPENIPFWKEFITFLEN